MSIKKLPVWYKQEFVDLYRKAYTRKDTLVITDLNKRFTDAPNPAQTINTFKKDESFSDESKENCLNEKLSFWYWLDLNKLKIKVEENRSDITINDLKKRFPELFSVDFNDLILNFEKTALLFKKQEGKDFLELFVEPLPSNQKPTLN